MFSTHSIPITFFLCPCERLFLTEVQALGWWNVLYICFRFGQPRTAVPRRANRSDENHCFPPSLSIIAGSFCYCWSESGLGFPVTISNFWPSSRLNLWLGFSWLLMLHFSVRTRKNRTPTFSSFVHRLFWLFVLCCYAPSVLVIRVWVRIVTRLRQFSVCITVKI
jgi:hypothetical protein